MKLTNAVRFGVTTVYLTKVLKDQVLKYNTEHPNYKIIMSEVARQAIEDKLNERLEEDKKE